MTINIKIYLNIYIYYIYNPKYSNFDTHLSTFISNWYKVFEVDFSMTIFVTDIPDRNVIIKYFI